MCASILGEVRKQEAEEKRGGVKALEDVICCSSEKEIPGIQGRKIGIEGVRWAVLSACGLDSDEEGRKRIFDMGAVQEENVGVGW